MFLWLVLGVVVSHLGIVWHMTRESPSACPERMRSRAVGGGPFRKPGVPRRISSLLQAVFFRRDDSDCYWTSDCASAWDWCDLRAFAINRSWRDFTIDWSCVTGETSLSTGTGNQCNLVVPSARERSPKLRRQAWLLLAYQLSGADDLRSLLLELVDGNPRVTND